MRRCTICGERAVARAAPGRRYLCAKHYVEHFERRVARTVEKYKLLRGVERLLVAVSGGKDSVALLHALHRLYGDRVELVGLTIDLGIEGYSSPQVEAAKRNFEALGVEYRVVRLSKEYGFTIDEASRRRKLVRRPTCSVCGIVKRYIMNSVALEVSADAVATGHNLDDLSLFTLMSIAQGRVDDLVKLAPRTERAGRLVSRIRPLALVSGKETLTYVVVLGAPFHHENCPHAPSDGLRPKLSAMLEALEDSVPEFRRMMYTNIVSNLLPRITRPAEVETQTCMVCGMPASGKTCSFCRIRLRLVESGKNRVATSSLRG